MASGDTPALKQVYDATCANLYGIIIRGLGERDVAYSGPFQPRDGWATDECQSKRPGVLCG
jgi:hypothetical protein